MIACKLLQGTERGSEAHNNRTISLVTKDNTQGQASAGLSDSTPIVLVTCPLKSRLRLVKIRTGSVYSRVDGYNTVLSVWQSCPLLVFGVAPYPTGHTPQDTLHRTHLTGHTPQDTLHRTHPTGHTPQDTPHSIYTPQDTPHRTGHTLPHRTHFTPQDTTQKHTLQDTPHRTIIHIP